MSQMSADAFAVHAPAWPRGGFTWAFNDFAGHSMVWQVAGATGGHNSSTALVFLRLQVCSAARPEGMAAGLFSCRTRHSAMEAGHFATTPAILKLALALHKITLIGSGNGLLAGLG